MNDLSSFADVASADHRLCVLSTTRSDGSVQSSVVNAGVVAHPLTGGDVVALVAEPRAHKVANLRARPNATLVAKAEWHWVAVEGHAEIVGQGESLRLAGERHRQLLRDVFAACIGGPPEDWRVHVDNMVLAQHAVVLVTPTRTYAGEP